MNAFFKYQSTNKQVGILLQRAVATAQFLVASVKIPENLWFST